jgi:hypothetical protein
VGLRVGTINHVRVAVGAFLELVEDSLEDLLSIPACELVVNGMPGTESFRQISPRDARLGDVEDRVHEGAVGQVRWPSTPTCLGWQQGFDSGPFRITQFVPVHHPKKPPDELSRKFLVAEFGDRP